MDCPICKKAMKLQVNEYEVPNIDMSDIYCYNQKEWVCKKCEEYIIYNKDDDYADVYDDHN
jgi:C4-type Zn-finger protein